jgi:hypothetical protein
MGTVDLSNISFNKPTYFNGTLFNAEANFANARFTKNICFERAIFSRNIKFSDAQFLKNANFSNAQFRDIAIFEGVRFNGTVEFSRDQFYKEADFDHALFTGDASFSGVQFDGNAKFSDAQFYGYTNFTNAQFNGDNDFRSAEFNGEVVGNIWFKLTIIYPIKDYFLYGLIIVMSFGIVVIAIIVYYNFSMKRMAPRIKRGFFGGEHKRSPLLSREYPKAKPSRSKVIQTTQGIEIVTESSSVKALKEVRSPRPIPLCRHFK